jgi:hypothetical protein
VYAIEAADRRRESRSQRLQGPDFGIQTSKAAVDGRAVMNRLREERDSFVDATRKSIEKLPADICVKQRSTVRG